MTSNPWPRILLVTPPFTQLNTPYPATAYLKGFLNTQGIESRQADLSLELILALFSRPGLERIFALLEASDVELSEQGYRVYSRRDDYRRTIAPVMRFLQHRNPTLAHAICSRTYLPEGARFAGVDDLDWAFGTLGTHDKARHLATLYLEDLGDLITEAVDPHFGFSRYAERLGRTAASFDELHAALQAPETIVTTLLTDLLNQHVDNFQPDVVGFTVPFPGNLFAALKGGQFIKTHFPEIKVVLGGGFANTELRRVHDERVFDCVDFIALDDGEAPLLFLLEHLAGRRPVTALKRIFLRTGGVVQYANGAVEKDVAQRETGTPDYRDLPLDDYLSVIEIANPMHRLWSDGRWNKLTLAHGCYWGKCTFCDVSLDYIQRYEPLSAAELCDRIETIIAQTGQHGFHFVDEAAPPALLRDLALEILRRGLTVVWWTNIRFEKTFSPALCALLKASGCIAVTGGLEVASDRLLELIKKGVTVAQVARVADAFTEAGILVHAYLMYGFPTQTAQETIDSLELVRQLFEEGIVQSGFWHRFAMTAHSPVGLAPAAYAVVDTGPEFAGFADNDRYHDDPTGADHDVFSEGLRTSLLNYMQGAGFDLPLGKWFDVRVPRTTVAPDFIRRAIADQADRVPRDTSLVVWLGPLPEVQPIDDTTVALVFYGQREEWSLELETEAAEWLEKLLPRLAVGPQPPLTWRELRAQYESTRLGSFEALEASSLWTVLKEKGLLVI
jgi:radical SAM superfamily enzyme YgiQ (UPF0313 family)